MSFPSVHKIVSFAKLCDAEIVLKFRTSQSNVLGLPSIILCIPIQSGVYITPDSRKYFQTLRTGATAGRPALADIIPPAATFIDYLGFDIFMMLNGMKCPNITQNPTNIVRYLVCEIPIGMDVADYNRFMTEIPMNTPSPGSGIASKQLTMPPVPAKDISQPQFIKNVSRIGKLILESGALPPPVIRRGGKGIPVAALKCQPVKQKGAEGKLTMDMTGRGITTSLEDELRKTHDTLNNIPGQPEENCKNMADVGIGFATLLGIVLGVLICALIVYFVMSYTFLNYREVVARAKNMVAKGPSVSLLPKFPELPHICKE